MSMRVTTTRKAMIKSGKTRQNHDVKRYEGQRFEVDSSSSENACIREWLSVAFSQSSTERIYDGYSIP
jgi:hypothetical protein